MISVVISAYNTSPWIDECLESIENQIYKDLEIIVVNDCSTDDTREKIIRHSEKDPRVKLIDNEVNVGAGLARRIGIKEATGDYIILIDSDDYISPDYIQSLYDGAVESKADITYAGMTIVTEDGQFMAKRHDDEVMFNNTQEKKGLNRLMFLNNKLITRELWNKVEYSELRYIEDVTTTIKLIYFSNSNHKVENYGYYYRQREGSLCHTDDGIKHMVYVALSLIDLIEFFKDKEDCTLKRANTPKHLFEVLLLKKLNGWKNEDIISKYPTEWARIVNYLNTLR